MSTPSRGAEKTEAWGYYVVSQGKMKRVPLLCLVGTREEFSVWERGEGEYKEQWARYGGNRSAETFPNFDQFMAHFLTEQEFIEAIVREYQPPSTTTVFLEDGSRLYIRSINVKLLDERRIEVVFDSKIVNVEQT